MTYTIRKSFDFSASHQLQGLPRGHPCARMHGHNYKIVVQITGPLHTPPGWVMDYGDLTSFRKWVDDNLDHTHLNDSAKDAGNPTAENLARFLAEVVEVMVPLPPGCTASVGVSETPKTWAWYQP